MNDTIAQFAPQTEPLRQNQILYALGGLKDSTKARQNITAQTCGFFASNFDQWNDEQQKRFYEAEQLTPFRVKAISEHLREAAAVAESNRLVKGRKSRTDFFSQQKAAKAGFDAFPRLKGRLQTLDKKARAEYDARSHHNADNFGSDGAAVRSHSNKQSLIADKPLVKLQLQAREWSGQYRLQQTVETPCGNAPEANGGERFTEKLTSRAVKNIFEAGAYVATCHGGFQTFLTLTLDGAARERVLSGMEYTDDGAPFSPVSFKQNFAVSVGDVAGPYTALEWYRGKIKRKTAMNECGEIAGPYSPIFAKPEKLWEVVGAKTTIGAEVSRFINALKKFRKRGGVLTATERCPESGRLFSPVPAVKASLLPEKRDFHYIWVAESPANDQGEPNLHVHLLMDWSVPQALFASWAARIEELWGNGYANLKRIKKSDAASSYIIKAVGYAAKGGNADQGLIRGNRYNIAQCSRAPKWEVLESFEAGNMAGILSELGHKLAMWRKPIERRIKRLESAKQSTIVSMAINKKAVSGEKRAEQLRARLEKIKAALTAAREERQSKGVFVSANNRFSMTFERGSEDKVSDFLCWAAGARGWSMRPLSGDDYIRDIRAAALAQYHQTKTRFDDNQALWQSVLNDPLIPIEITHEQAELERAYSWHLYEEHGAMVRA
ncbi:hypothetical protein HGP28_10655 [Vibrio sp. SM6]|uniref:Replication protein n=1 Tax=Vibrio agarilyticus TaxID=2726741 RepID=A0A7X8TRM4_9VIBR|nr:hypothetical protein [Vibrio agarilyticus]NLS13352.1 hypothetical protein [Vibrio agarilyticus]